MAEGNNKRISHMLAFATSLGMSHLTSVGEPTDRNESHGPNLMARKLGNVKEFTDTS